MSVPLVPGVPALFAGVSTTIGIALVTADAVSAFTGILFGPQWGIFDILTGLPAVAADSIGTVDFRQDYVISDYPLEGGGAPGAAIPSAFESYDKVQLPSEVRVRLVTGSTFASRGILGVLSTLQNLIGGSATPRSALIVSTTALANSLRLVDIVTPDITYTSMNVTHFDYRRFAGNVGMLIVDIWAVKVRVQAIPSFSNTQQPQSADPVGGGNVQTQPVPTDTPIPPPSPGQFH